MTIVLAPYHAGMLLGQGFNSFSQQAGAYDSVVRWDRSDHDNSLLDVNSLPKVNRDVLSRAQREGSVTHAPDHAESLQNISWTMDLVEHISDVTNEIGIAPSAAIREGLFFDTGTFLASDLNFLIQVKIITEEIHDEKLTRFSPHREVQWYWGFERMYGDTFISGFFVGGEFSAVVSANLTADSNVTEWKATRGLLQRGTNLSQISSAITVFKETEYTISVYKSGKELKTSPEIDDWTTESLAQALQAFPRRIADAPRKTRAILTPYHLLSGFNLYGARYIPVDYLTANQYMRTILNDYFKYQHTLHSILNAIHNVQYRSYSLDFQPDEDRLRPHVQKVLPIVTNGINDTNGTYRRRIEQAKKSSGHYIEGYALRAGPVSPFPPTLWGLQTAFSTCIREMSEWEWRIDIIEDHPWGMYAGWWDDYVDPAFFKTLLPVLVPPPDTSNSTTYDESSSQSRRSCTSASRSDSIKPIISTVIWGGHTVTSPSVFDRITDYATTQEIFTLDNEFFGLDPFFGRRKWAAIAYQTNPDSEVFFLIDIEGSSAILLESSNPIVEKTLAISKETVVQEGSEFYILVVYLVVYGGHEVQDEKILKRFLEYVMEHETFTVSNYIFGGDPMYGERKWCFVAYKWGWNEDMRFFVGWEGERRSLAGKKPFKSREG